MPVEAHPDSMSADGQYVASAGQILLQPNICCEDITVGDIRHDSVICERLVTAGRQGDVNSFDVSAGDEGERRGTTHEAGAHQYLQG